MLFLKSNPTINQPAIAICILFIAVFSLYYPTLNAKVIDLDDTELITDLNDPAKKKELKNIFGNGTRLRNYYRPLLRGQFMLEQKIWQFEYSGYHLTNIILHFFNTVLVFLLALKYFKRKRDGDQTAVAFFVAMLFSVHPLATESVAWISGRSDVFGTLFALLALVSYFQPTVWRYFLTMIFILLALLSKESMLSIVPVIVLINMGLKVREKKKPSTILITTLIWSICCIVPLLTYLYLKLFGLNLPVQIFSESANIRTNTSENPSIVINWHFFKILPAATAFYLKKLFFPYPLNFAINTINTELYTIVSFIFAGLIIFIGYIKKLYGVVFYSVLLVVSFSAAYIVLYVGKAWVVFAERYLYITLPFFGAAGGELFCYCKDKFPKNNNLLVVMAIFVLTIFSATTLHRNLVWSDKTALWQDTLDKNPQNIKVLYKTACAYLADGDYEKYIIYLKRAEKVNKKDDWMDHIFLGLALYENNQGNDVVSLKYAVKTLSSSSSVYVLHEVSKLLKSLDQSGFVDKNKHIREAVKAHKKLYKITKNPNELFAVGELYEQLNEIEKAVYYFNEIIDTHPKGRLLRDSKMKVQTLAGEI